MNIRAILTALAAAATLAIATHKAPAAPPTNLNIQTQADYTAFTDAIRATEYIRQTFVIEDREPRIVASLAALAAFASQNPLATQPQLESFAFQFDAALAAAVPGDAALAKPGSLRRALVATTLPSDAALLGTNTHVARDVFERLGLTIAGLDGLLEAERRMTQFDRTTLKQFAYSTAFADTLISLLLGRDGSPTPRPDLSAAATAFLAANNLDPMLGQTDPAQTQVNAALANLPDFATFQALTQDPDPAANAAILADIDAIRAESQATLDAITALAAASPDTLMQDAAALIDAADAGDQAAIDQLAAINQAIQDRANAVAEERARASANALLLLQSDFPDVQAGAQNTRDYTAIQLETNNGLAIAEQSFGIAGSLVGVAAGIASKNPYEAVQSGLELVGQAIGLGDTLGGGPTVDEQVFDQVVALRQQVADLGNQLNERFDVVDQKLDTIFQTTVLGFQQLGSAIGDLQQSVDAIALQIFQARADLNRIEESLFLLSEALFLDLLNLNAQAVLDYRNDTGIDLPYAAASPSFIDGANTFLGFATFTATNPPFIDSTFTLNKDTADIDLLDEPLGRKIAALNTVPAGLTLADGTPYAPGPFVAQGTIPAPAAWAQPAAMYAQLARENPWYFAFQLASQNAASPGNTDIDQIIDTGTVLTGLSAAARDPQLFEALITNARNAAEDTQAELNAAALASTASLGTNTQGQTVNPWGPLDQGNFTARIPRLSSITLVQFPNTGTVPTSTPSNGYAITVGNVLDTPVDVANRQDLINRIALARLTNTKQGDNFFTFLDARPNTAAGAGRATFRMITVLQRSNSSVWLVVREMEAAVSKSTGGAATVTQSLLDQLVNYLGGLNAFYDDIDDGNASLNYVTPIFLQFIPPATLVTARVSFQSQTDTTFIGDYDPGDTPLDLTNDIAEGLASLRPAARDAIILALDPQATTPLNTAADSLNNAEALLDAYATLAIPSALDQSEILRSALRGLSDVGIRRDNLLLAINEAELNDTGALGGATPFDIPSIETEWNTRLDILQAEIDAALANPGPFDPYIEHTIAELTAARANAFNLATDDTYQTFGPLTVSAPQGLLANNTLQPGRNVQVDLAFQASQDFIAPANGSLSLNADGSFTYTPNPGFTGTDTFNYRATALIDPNAVGSPFAFSDPADVVVIVTDTPPCPTDLNSDSATDLADLLIVLAAFGTTADGDTNNDGLTQLDDLLAVLAAFGTSCP